MIVGLGRRLIRKSVRAATPRSVRRAMHPVRTVKRAVTPRPLRQVSRAVYTVTNPLGAAENKLLNTLFPSHRSKRGQAVPAKPVWRPYALAPAVAPPFEDQLAALMAVQRSRFMPALRPTVPPPPPVDPATYRRAEWTRRKHEARFRQPAARRRLRAEIEHTAQTQATRERSRLQDIQQGYQARADAWWQALCAGHPQTLHTALATAFADNPAPVRISEAAGPQATLVLLLPHPRVLPARKPHLTPTGRRSSREWTKTDLQQAYADLLGAHLLATARESWAVAPSLTTLRILGVQLEPPTPHLLFDVTVHRSETPWHNDQAGAHLLSQALHRPGRTREVTPLPTTGLRPDAPQILATVGLTG